MGGLRNNKCIGESEDKKIDLLVKTPRYMTEDMWFWYVSSLIQDERHYWVLDRIYNITVKFVEEVKRGRMNMRGLKLIDVLLENVNVITIKQKDGTCVADYIFEVVKGQYGFTYVSYDKLKSELGWSKDGISSEEIIEWRDKFHRNVSVYALDPLYKRFINKPAINKKNIITLCYLIKDNHCIQYCMMR